MKTKTLLICALSVVVVVTVILAGVVMNDNDESHGIEIVQSNGEKITVDGNYERIVVTGTYVVEALWAMGAEDRVAGVSNSAFKSNEYSELVKGKADVGDWTTPSIDKILEVNADCIIVYTSQSTKNLDALYKTGIQVIQLDCADYVKLPGEIRSLGEITNCEARAEKIANLLERVLEKARTNSNLTNVSALLESFSENNVCVDDSSVTDVWTIAGGTNIFHGPGNSMNVQSSAILEKNPDYIIKRISTPKWNSTDKQSVLENIANRPGYSDLNAVKDGKLYAIANAAVGGIRSFEGIIIFAELLNPGSMGGLTLESCVAEYNSIAHADYPSDYFYAYHR